MLSKLLLSYKNKVIMYYIIHYNYKLHPNMLYSEIFLAIWKDGAIIYYFDIS